MELNERQIKAVLYVKERGRITNKEYQELNIISKRTAKRDLEELVKKEIINQIGITGRGTEYVLKRGQKGDKGVKKAPERRQSQKEAPTVSKQHKGSLKKNDEQ